LLELDCSIMPLKSFSVCVYAREKQIKKTSEGKRLPPRLPSKVDRYYANSIPCGCVSMCPAKMHYQDALPPRGNSAYRKKSKWSSQCKWNKPQNAV